MIEAFDIHDVNPNPARFDPKKCEAINAEQVRALGETDFRDRLVPYLADAYPDPTGETAQVPLVSADSFDKLTAREQEILNEAAPLIQTRIQLLRESRDMLGFLFVSDDALVVDDKALAKLKASAGDVLDAGFSALEGLSPEQWDKDHLEDVLKTAIVEGRACPTARGSNRGSLMVLCALRSPVAGFPASVRVNGDPGSRLDPRQDQGIEGPARVTNDQRRDLAGWAENTVFSAHPAAVPRFL